MECFVAGISGGFCHVVSETSIEQEIRPVLKACLCRIRSWLIPHIWSSRDWFYETEEVATVAVWQAAADYHPPELIVFRCFVHRRIMSCTRTRYRQEHLYGLRFSIYLIEHGAESHEQLTLERSSTPYAEPLTEPLTYGDLTGALAKLSRTQQFIIEQLFWFGKSESTLAKALGISQRAVSKRKQVALNALRKELQEK